MAVGLVLITMPGLRESGRESGPASQKADEPLALPEQTVCDRASAIHAGGRDFIRPDGTRMTR